MDLKLIQNNGAIITRNLQPFVQGHNDNADLNIIGNSIFLLEQIVRTTKVNKIQIPVYGNFNSDVSEIVEDIIYQTAKKEIDVGFYENKQKMIKKEDKIKKEKTCLFSCGLDSFSGIYNAQKKYGNILASMTLHNDQHTLGKIIRKNRKLLSDKKIKFVRFKAPKHGSEMRYSRGALYALNGLSLGNRELIVAECGTTMFQPRFAPFDSVAKTANPKILLLTKSLAEKVVGEKIKIIQPNADRTKAEIISACRDKNSIEITHSCRSTIWCSGVKTHEGCCYGCVTRQIGEIINGVVDNTYQKIPFEKDTNTDIQISELIQLTRFSHDFLEDYTMLPQFMTEEIVNYNKVDLFERTAKDTIAALYLLEKQGKLKESLLNKWLIKSKEIFSKEKIENRIEEVKEIKFKPDFENFLQ